MRAVGVVKCQLALALLALRSCSQAAISSMRVCLSGMRNGTANLFMLFAPLEGWRHVKVTDRHTAVDYAHVLKDLADVHFANAKTIVLVQDNLNIHSKASLYEAFPAAEARRLVERFEWHYTPKHGSWLDLAESELGVLSSQCLDRRIPDKRTLVEEIAAWELATLAQISTPSAAHFLK